MGADTTDYSLLAKARTLWTSGRLDAALQQFEVAVAARPQNVRAIVECAQAAGQRYHIVRAETLLQAATALAGTDPNIASSIAHSFRLIHRPRQAIAALEQLRLAAVLPLPLLGELAVLYEQTNQLEKALDAIRECVDGAPEQTEPKLVLARIQRVRGESRSAESLLNELLRSADAAPMLRVRAWTELCHIRDEDGAFGSAVAAIEEAKTILRLSPQADRLVSRGVALNEAFRRIYSQLDSTTLSEWRAARLPPDSRCSGIAHLLGFPRSGTTLLEQIIEAHPQVIGSPERSVFSKEIFPAMYRIRGDEPLEIESLRAITDERLIEQRRRYLDCMEAILGESLGGRVHLDKNPNHTSLIVGLFRLFPESRFLFALRDPRDVVVSAYLRFFPLTEFSAAFLTWEGTCAQYANDMNIWLSIRESIRDDWLQVRYEDLVEDPVAQGRRSVEFLQLEWHEALNHYRDVGQNKIINSPSQAAVREPIHKQAIGRWRNYERYLKPCLNRLTPYCRAFGYS